MGNVPVSGSGANGPDTQKHPRVTVGDENGKVYFEDLFRTITAPLMPPMSGQAVARVAAASVATTYSQVMTVNFPVSIIQVFNSFGASTDVTLGLQYGGFGPITDKWRLEGDGFTLDLRSGLVLLPPTTIIYIKYTTQPSSGSLRITLI